MEDITILIVDDKADFRRVLKEDLEELSGRIAEASDGIEALKKLDGQNYDVVTLDLDMPRMDGLTALKRIRETDEITPIVVLTGTGSIDKAVQAIKSGADDFLEIPYGIDRLLVTLRNAISMGRMRREAESSKRLGYSKPTIIGKSKAFQSVLEDARKAAATDFVVLLQGESGCGKDILAEYIYTQSKRCGRPFVPVDCGAISETLFESEMFGHTRGAFTGAVRDRVGKFQLAHTGTLFLNEVGNLSLTLQGKLLTVLQEGEITRPGADTPIKVDFRLICATNIDLKRAVEDGKFREDLYHRVSEVPLIIPPLRDRREDIIPLAEHYLKKLCFKEGVPEKSLSPEAGAVLIDMNWPGNVRRLISVIKRLIIFAQSETITPEDIQKVIGTDAPDTGEQLENLDTMVIEYKRRLVLKALVATDDNKAEAAHVLGITRPRLYRILEETSNKQSDI